MRYKVILYIDFKEGRPTKTAVKKHVGTAVKQWGGSYEPDDIFFPNNLKVRVADSGKPESRFKPTTGKTPEQLGIVSSIRIPPENGWVEGAYYIVDAAFSSNNPIHRKILFTGFLRNGELGGGYCGFMSSDAETLSVGEAYYLKAIREIRLDI